MGFWGWLTGTPKATLPSSPYSGDGGASLVQLTVAELFAGNEYALDAATAARVPGLKRALAAHCGTVAQIPFRQYAFDQLVPEQPEWLTNSLSGVSPYHRMFGVTRDLFWHGWALLGMELGPDGYPVDALHIPYEFWTVDQNTGEITIDERIDKRYHELPVAIPLGLDGILVDAADTIRAARYIERAWQDRIKNPIAQTDLHITDASLSLSRKDKLKLAKQYNEGRQLPGGSTSVTDPFIEVKHHDAPGDLFESGRNAVRLDLANHALVPASLIEGAKNGSAGEINYSNETTKRNELYDFGTSLYVNAIAARLSMDDICPPGQSIRPDLSHLMQVPTPTTVPALED